MNLFFRKTTAAGLLSLAIVGGLLSATAPAQATHKFGHAILGGIIGGVIGGAIVNRNNNYYNDRRPDDFGVQVYQQPRRCWWENRAYHDQWGVRRINRVQVCS